MYPARRPAGSRPSRGTTVGLLALISLAGIAALMFLASPVSVFPGALRAALRAADASAETADPVRVADQQIAAQWKLHGLIPSRRASDYDFIRRASLDIIGRIATADEVAHFLRDPATTRRRLLVDRLLASPEYARNWASIWTVWLLTRSAPALSREQMQTWLERQFSSTGQGFDRVVMELLTASGKSDTNGAVNFLLINQGEPVPADRQAEEGYAEFVPATSRTTRLFLGLQIQCTQCHDHPFNTQWKQKHFWGVNAFFRQTKPGRPPMRRAQRQIPAPALALADDPSVNAEGAVFYEERRGTLLMGRPEFLDGRRMPGGPGPSRREVLARSVTGSPFFAKAYVNRMWAHFFGRGFTNPGPADDFGDHDPVTHPLLPEEMLSALRQPRAASPGVIQKAKDSEEDREKPRLLDYLAEQFRARGHDPRALIRWICGMEAYQLSSTANGTNDKPQADPYFSRVALKALSPEQLFESLMVATQAEAAEGADARRQLREAWTRNLIANFGDDEGNEVTFNGTVVQALILMNGKELNEALTSRNKGTVAQAIVFLARRGQRPALDHLYLAALNRPATEREFRVITREVGLIRSGNVRTADPWSLWQDAFWAVLNSNEFVLNH